MSQENKAIVRRIFEEVWNQGNLDVIDELFSPNYVVHFLPPDVSPDREGFKKFVTMYRVAYPDIHMHIEDQIAEGDRVVFRFTGNGTHQGELMGIPPTGKEVTLTGIAIIRLAGGQNVEAWAELDRLGMLQQLGVVPPPGEAGG